MVSYSQGCIKYLKEFSKKTDIIIRSDCLELFRKYEIPESSRKYTLEERPGYWTQYHSITFKGYSHKNAKELWCVMILDDIVTTGAHMRACRQRLVDIGVARKEIICLAMGRTIK